MVHKGNLVKTIAEYNAAAEAGTGADLFPPKTGDGRCVPIATPPFYASIVMDSNDFKLGLVELGGVVTDANQQVLDRDDNPIEGLYATGNCCGGRFIAQYHTPIAGISIGWATSMGKLAGETVAAL